MIGVPLVAADGPGIFVEEASRHAESPPQVSGFTLTETFDDPLGDWHEGFLYLNTNAESYYYASGNCDADYRGNQPQGIWISDDQGCGGMVVRSPVSIVSNNPVSHAATMLGIDIFTCVDGVTLNVYGADGELDISVPLESNCWNFTHYEWALANGISRVDLAYSGGQVEGNTSIDNVQIDIR